MTTDSRERKSSRMFYGLILILLVGYGIMKTRHIQLALKAYEGQPLMEDTSRAAK